MSDFNIHTCDLIDSASMVNSISSQLTNAGSDAASVADMVPGRENLREAIWHFADDWVHHRMEIVGQLNTLSSALNKSAATIEKMDKELAASLEQANLILDYADTGAPRPTPERFNTPLPASNR